MRNRTIAALIASLMKNLSECGLKTLTLFFVVKTNSAVAAIANDYFLSVIPWAVIPYCPRSLHGSKSENG